MFASTIESNRSTGRTYAAVHSLRSGSSPATDVDRTFVAQALRGGLDELPPAKSPSSAPERRM